MNRRRAVLFAMMLMALGLPYSALAQGYQGPARVNFDERLIKGQTTKAGSVYIFDRKQTQISSLVSRVRKFRQKIILTVFED